MPLALKSCFNSVSWDADCRIQRRISVLQADESENEEVAMLYAILAYHVEAEVNSWSAEEDTVVMANLRKAHDRLFSNLRNPAEPSASEHAQRRREQH